MDISREDFLGLLVLERAWMSRPCLDTKKKRRAPSPQKKLNNSLNHLSGPCTGAFFFFNYDGRTVNVGNRHTCHAVLHMSCIVYLYVCIFNM